MESATATATAIDPMDHKGLVYMVAKRYRGLGVPWEDLVQEGFLALLQAGRGYERGKMVEFSTYATTSITRRLRRYVDDRRLVRVSHDLYTLRWKIRTKRLAPEAIDAATAERLRLASAVLDQPIQGIHLFDPASSPQRQSSPEVEHARRLLEMLPRAHRAVVEEYHGIGCDPIPFTEIGRRRGYSRQRAGDIYRSAMRRLRHYSGRPEMAP